MRESGRFSSLQARAQCKCRGGMRTSNISAGLRSPQRFSTWDQAGCPPPLVGIWKRDEVVFGACDDGGRRKPLAFSSSAAKRDVILPDKDYSNENLNRNLVCQLLAHEGCKAREL